MTTLQRLPQELLVEILSIPVDGLSEHQRDEMAIPSYLHANPLIRWLMWRRYEVIATLAAFDRSMTVLEFGCGIGLFLPTLACKCAHVYAADLFPQFAEQLAVRLGLSIAFVAAVAEIPDASLDRIIAADVLEHLEEPAAYFDLFARKLKPGGELIVSGPSENLVYRVGRLIAGFGDKGDYHHTNIDRLAEGIARTGFAPAACVPLPFRFLPVLFKVCRFRRPV